MPEAAISIGGPGAGKTTRAMEIMLKCFDLGYCDPMRTGYVAFTRAARREAASRAADRFGIPLADLEKHGWFRTLHSCCYRILGVPKGMLLTGGKDDDDWLRNAIHSEGARVSTNDLDDDGMSFHSMHDDSTRALAIWDIARNMLVPFSKLYERFYASDWRLPALGDCLRIISDYERAKLRDDRLDYCDLLMQVAGRKWNGRDAFDECDPQGEIPALPVWFLDEAQDISLLAALVFRRLIEPSLWVYLLGDDWQSIYGWCGADGKIFANWPAAKKEILPISYRCRQNILDLGNRLMRGTSDYQPRAFRAQTEGGDIMRRHVLDAIATIKPGEDTLVLARTNLWATAAANLLNENLIPWKPIKGGGGYAAPSRISAVTCLLKLARGERADGHELADMLKLMPSRLDGVELFVRGTKTWFEEKTHRDELYPVTLAESDCFGATRRFKDLVSSGRYIDLLEEPARKAIRAAERHGLAAIQKPTVRVGTCHASKGGEADHVVALNQIPRPTVRACEEAIGMDEESRVWYTTVTRARDRLTIADCDNGEPFPGL